MKKLIRTLTLTIGVCLALLCSVQAIELKTGIGIVETNGLRLRAKPSTEADILDNASYGDNVVIIRESGDFYLVDYNLLYPERPAGADGKAEDEHGRRGLRRTAAGRPREAVSRHALCLGRHDAERF